MDLEEAIKTIKRIVVEAMASDSIGRYILANLADLVSAAQVVFEFGLELLQEEKVGQRLSLADTQEAGEVYALLCEANGEECLPQLGPMTWIMIAVQVAKLIWRYRRG